MASFKLTDKFLKSAKAGRHGDGRGLYLEVSPNLNKRFIYRFTLKGRTSEVSLGLYPAVTLTEARRKAEEQRILHKSGVNPVEVKRRVAATSQKGRTFAQVTEEFLEAKSGEWSNAKHRQQWKNTLSQHAEKLSDLNVEEITTEDVLSVLMPIWNEIPETASRVRGRIESILDYAKVRKLREGENPASWRGNLAHVLPKRQILTRGHHRALPYTEIPEFIKTVRTRNDMSAIALEITILTALRTSEVIKGEWSEIDFEKEIWTIPAARTKAKRAHRIPLTPRIIQLLSQLRERKFNKFIFPSGKAESSLSSNAMEMLLRRLDAKNTTVHGMRSSFRDWAGDETEAQREVIEAALGHVIGDKAEAAYRRGDAMAKRRALMISWEEYCCGSKKNSNVVSLKPSKSRS